MDVSIFPRKEMHLPDYNRFGKLHFNAESLPNKEVGPVPLKEKSYGCIIQISVLEMA